MFISVRQRGRQAGEPSSPARSRVLDERGGGPQAQHGLLQVFLVTVVPVAEREGSAEGVQAHRQQRRILAERFDRALGRLDGLCQFHGIPGPLVTFEESAGKVVPRLRRPCGTAGPGARCPAQQFDGLVEVL